MIDKRLMNIKNLLKIIISCFVVVTMFKSCAKAYTNEDLTNFIDQLLLNDNVNSTTKDRLGTLKNNLNSLFNYMSNNNIDISDYKGFSFELQNSQGAYNLYLYTNNTIPSFQNVSYLIQYYDYIHRDNYGYYQLIRNNNSKVIVASNDSFTANKYFGLVDGFFNNLQPFGNLNYFDNYYTPKILFEYNPVYSVASGDQTYIKIDYVSNFVPLGVLGSNEYYQLDAKFRDELSMKNLFNWSDVPGTRTNIKRPIRI